MDWSPMISGSFFDGVRTDMLTAVGGILSLSLIILGLVMLVRAIGR